MLITRKTPTLLATTFTLGCLAAAVTTAQPAAAQTQVEKRRTDRTDQDRDRSGSTTERRRVERDAQDARGREVERRRGSQGQPTEREVRTRSRREGQYGTVHDGRLHPIGTIRYYNRSTQTVTRTTRVTRLPEHVVVRDGHRHVVRHRPYPRRGTTYVKLPPTHTTVVVHGRRYYRSGDVFYLQVGHGREVHYIVSRPPRGVYIEYLPNDYEIIRIRDTDYYYCDDTYYVARLIEGALRFLIVEPPIGGTLVHLPDDYEIVNIEGRTYYRIGDEYYKAVLSQGLVVYERVSF